MKMINALKGIKDLLSNGPEAELQRHKIAFRLSSVVLNRLVQSQDDEHRKFQLAEALSSLVYPEYKFSEFGRSFLQDEALLSIYGKFHDQSNWHSLDRKFFLRELLRLADGVEGDTAECGVFQGASSALICQHNLGKPRRHHLFDSFEGLSQPRDIDGSHWQPNDLSCSEEQVRFNLSGFDSIMFHKGWIPEGFSDVNEASFSFVHIDVDLYDPTLDSLRFFYPRLLVGGIIVCDDYGFLTCPGARRAMDEFFVGKPEAIIQSPSGQAFVVKRECSFRAREHRPDADQSTIGITPKC